MQTWKRPASDGGTHTITQADDGLMACSCRGYKFKRKDKPRCCSHIEDVCKTNGLNIVQDGDFVRGIAGAEPVQVKPEVDYVDVKTKAEADGYINPMLAQAMTTSHGKPDLDKYLDGWLWDEKADGQRVVLAVKNNKALAWSRPRPGEGTVGHPRTLPAHLKQHAEALPDGTYDCEQLVVGDRSWAVSDLTKRDQQVLVMFDQMVCMDKKITDLPIERRRHILETVLNTVASPYLRFNKEITPGRTGVEQIWASGGEGAMVKRLGSLYKPGQRSPDWLKIKLWDYTTCEVIGFETAKSGPYSVILFRMPSGVESKCKTLGNKWLAEFEKNGPSYVGRRLVVKHQGLTPDGAPRHPQMDHFAGEGE
jgi:hypothetical protein